MLPPKKNIEGQFFWTKHNKLTNRFKQFSSSKGKITLSPEKTDLNNPMVND